MTAPSPLEAPTKIPHLVMALLFLGTAATWALVVLGWLTPGALPYAVPALLVTAGVGGLAALVAGARRRTPRPNDHDDDHHDHRDHDTVLFETTEDLR